MPLHQEEQMGFIPTTTCKQVLKGLSHQQLQSDQRQKVANPAWNEMKYFFFGTGSESILGKWYYLLGSPGQLY